MLSVLAAALLAAAPAKIAAPRLEAVNVKPEVAAFLTEHLAREMKRRGLRVISAQEIQTLIGVEREKELKSCGDEAKASCMAELSGALGVDALLTGSLGRFEDVFQVHVSVVSATTAATLAIYDGKAEGGEKVELEELTRAAEALADALNPREKSSWARPAVLAPAAVGVLALGGAVAFRQAAASSYEQLARPSAPLHSQQIEQLASDGKLDQTLAWACLGAGVVALGAAVTMAAMPGEPPSANVGVVIAPGRAGLVVAGSF